MRFYRFVVIILYGHTFATFALEAGVDLKTVSDMLGHSTIEITADIYLHISYEQQNIAIDKISNFLYNDE